MNESLRIGMAQMRVTPGQPRINLLHAQSYIEKAALAKCDVVVLPECLDIGWGDLRARELAEPLQGTSFQMLALAAQQHGIHVVAGLVERDGEHLYNSAVFIDDQGGLLLHHRKIHELAVAGGIYSIGDRLAVARSKLGIVGISICADNAPESLAIGHVLARMGAQIILSPCAWAVAPDHDNHIEPYGELWRRSYGKLADLYDLPVVGVSNVGRIENGAWKDWKVIGCSLAMRGDGSIAMQGEYGSDAENLYISEVPLRKIVPLGDAVINDISQRGHRDF
ncbi:carbon-nitrogen hydrolase family protein [Undibacterium sp. SXout20W]|uniref:carbon-nitrogen hydrolase family protein n=1 Tax=Undibacterium sp. SXout20W TaxID=3413051 RepID=UPI003BF21122